VWATSPTSAKNLVRVALTWCPDDCLAHEFLLSDGLDGLDGFPQPFASERSESMASSDSGVGWGSGRWLVRARRPTAVEVPRNVTISVRFSQEEIGALRREADTAGVKVTAYIRAAALQASAPVDRKRLQEALRAVSEDVARAERLLIGEGSLGSDGR